MGIGQKLVPARTGMTYMMVIRFQPFYKAVLCRCNVLKQLGQNRFHDAINSHLPNWAALGLEIEK